MKGGYKIIDFKNVSISNTPVTMTDVLVDLLNNYNKVVLLSNVVLSGSAKDDCFSTVLSDGEGGVKLNCYDGYITITSEGAVTYTIASISDIQGRLGNLEVLFYTLESNRTLEIDLLSSTTSLMIVLASLTETARNIVIGARSASAAQFSVFKEFEDPTITITKSGTKIILANTGAYICRVSIFKLSGPITVTKLPA